jgi:hypothetical protein
MEPIGQFPERYTCLFCGLLDFLIAHNPNLQMQIVVDMHETIVYNCIVQQQHEYVKECLFRATIMARW